MSSTFLTSDIHRYSTVLQGQIERPLTKAGLGVSTTVQDGGHIMYPGLRRTDKATCQWLRRLGQMEVVRERLALATTDAPGRAGEADGSVPLHWTATTASETTNRRPWANSRPSHPLSGLLGPKGHATGGESARFKKVVESCGSCNGWRMVGGAWRVVDGGLDAAMSVRAGLVSLQ